MSTTFKSATTNIDEGFPADVELSIAQKAVAQNVENEKCVVSLYKTTTEQKTAFEKLLRDHEATHIPVEWVIDIADETNGWFYGTAYHYNDETNMLHVMVPDSNNPSFDGEIPLDHRTVHLLECIDNQSNALFNKIIRDSVTKIQWDLEWFEEGAGTEVHSPGEPGSPQGLWSRSTGRYYFPIMNQLLAEDENFSVNGGYVFFTADKNVRFHLCQNGSKAIHDFIRLITENIVQGTYNALEDAHRQVSAAENWARRRQGLLFLYSIGFLQLRRDYEKETQDTATLQREAQLQAHHPAMYEVCGNNDLCREIITFV